MGSLAGYLASRFDCHTATYRRRQHKRERREFKQSWLSSEVIGAEEAKNE